MITWDIAPRCVCCSCCIDGKEARGLQSYRQNGAMADVELPLVSICSEILERKMTKGFLLRIENLCRVCPY